MGNVIEWFLFAMFVWGCVIAMQALQNRFAPEGENATPKKRHRRRAAKGDKLRKLMEDVGLEELYPGEDSKDKEIRELRERLQVLETIVTDRQFQWEQDYRRNR